MEIMIDDLFCDSLRNTIVNDRVSPRFFVDSRSLRLLSARRNQSQETHTSWPHPWCWFTWPQPRCWWMRFCCHGLFFPSVRFWRPNLSLFKRWKYAWSPDSGGQESFLKFLLGRRNWIKNLMFSRFILRIFLNFFLMECWKLDITVHLTMEFTV